MSGTTDKQQFTDWWDLWGPTEGQAEEAGNDFRGGPEGIDSDSHAILRFAQEMAWKAWQAKGLPYEDAMSSSDIMLQPFANAPTQFTPTDAKDVAFLSMMSNTKIAGEVNLPSGKQLPAPPPGKVWLADKGQITQIEDKR